MYCWIYDKASPSVDGVLWASLLLEGVVQMLAESTEPGKVRPWSQSRGMNEIPHGLIIRNESVRLASCMRSSRSDYRSLIRLVLNVGINIKQRLF